MKIKDSQFARHFLLNEIDLSHQAVRDILNYEIEIVQHGEPDTVVDRGNKLICTNPSSIARFLFNIFYRTLSKFIVEDKYKDKLGLGLFGLCKQYVYADYDPTEFDGPPVLIDCDKLPVVKFILTEIIEPVAGRIKRFPVFFIPCRYTDTCRVIESQNKLIDEYELPNHSVQFSNFPLILTNCNIYNSPARQADLITKLTQLSLGSKHSNRVIKTMLLDEESGLLKNLILILKTLRGEPNFVIDFLEHLAANVITEPDELDQSVELQSEIITSDQYLGQHIRLAQGYTRHDPQGQRIDKQWSQWNMLVGLIEKQLTPMRGSMWPAKEILGPIEERRKKMISDKSRKKGTQLNYEEMLEIARDEYDHNARPGELIETMLKDNRVW